MAGSSDPSQSKRTYDIDTCYTPGLETIPDDKRAGVRAGVVGDRAEESWLWSGVVVIVVVVVEVGIIIIILITTLHHYHHHSSKGLTWSAGGRHHVVPELL